MGEEGTYVSERKDGAVRLGSGMLSSNSEVCSLPETFKIC